VSQYLQGRRRPPAAGYAGVMRTRKSRLRAGVGYAVVGAACMVVAATAYGGYRLYFGVPLRIDVTAEKVLVDTQWFGEYCSPVSRIRLTDLQNERRVWEVVSSEEDGATAVWYFALVPGRNLRPEHLPEGFEWSIPADGASFLLEPGRRYRIDVWGTNVWHHSSRTFVLRTPDARESKRQRRITTA